MSAGSLDRAGVGRDRLGTIFRFRMIFQFRMIFFVHRDDEARFTITLSSYDPATAVLMTVRPRGVACICELNGLMFRTGNLVLEVDKSPSPSLPAASEPLP